jgi:hypothetical protein
MKVDRPVKMHVASSSSSLDARPLGPSALPASAPLVVQGRPLLWERGAPSPSQFGWSPVAAPRAPRRAATAS